MLTAKQEKFVQGLIEGKSQREAYKAAYDAERMKDSTIDDTASKLLKKPEIAHRYKELRHASEDKAADDATTIRAKIIQLYSDIAFKTPNMYYEMGENRNGDLVPMLREDFLECDGPPIKSISYDSRGNLKLEFYDRTVGADRLREMYGMEAQQSEQVSVKIEIPDEYAK